MSGRVYSVVAVLIACWVVFAVGCGSDRPEAGEPTTNESSTSATDTTPVAASDEWGSFPADPSLDEREVVEAYVQALDERDGVRFCSLVAPWISGRFDIGGTDPDASLQRPVRCPELIAGFIGYIEDCCPPKFLGAEVTDVGELDRRGDVVGVPITVTLSLEDTGNHHKYEEALDDVVWVTQDSGAWRVAKLSKVAAAASMALAREVEAAEKRRRLREEAYREVKDTASCADARRYPDALKDVVDYRHPAPPTPTPQLPAADIRAVQVDAARGRICVVLETAGAIRHRTTFEFAIESSDFDWGRSGFAQSFEVELRADGRVRVSSGLDDDRRSVSVPAAVGLEGNRLMATLDRASFAAGRTLPGSVVSSRPLERFQFRADATVVLSEKRYLHDDLGPGPPQGILRFTYP